MSLLTYFTIDYRLHWKRIYIFDSTEPGGNGVFVLEVRKYPTVNKHTSNSVAENHYFSYRLLCLSWIKSIGCT